MRGTDFVRWCKSCRATERGRIWIRNALYDVVNEAVAGSVVADFCTAVDKLLAGITMSDGMVSEPQAYYDKVIYNNESKFLCKGQGQLKNSACSRIINAKDFLKRNLRPEFVEENGLYDTDLVHPRTRFFQVYERVYAFRDTGWSRGEMSGARPIAWVTKTDRVLDLRQDPDQDSDTLPERLRDMLGLNHYAEDEFLIEIKYPDDTTKSLSLAPPTFLDAGPNLVFISSRDETGWGIAVDLQTLKEGLPEAVHSPIPLTDDFGFEPVGQLSSLSQDVNWRVLANDSDADCSECGSDATRCPLLAGAK